MTRTHEDVFSSPGQLRWPIAIQAESEPIDDFRGTREMQTYLDTRATYDPLSGTRTVTMNQIYGNVTASVITRYDPRVKPGHRVLRKDTGQVAVIVAVLPASGGNRWMELMVNEAVT